MDIGLPKLFRPVPGLSAADLCGRAVERLRRRAKILILDLSDGLALLIHLKLAGQLVHVSADGQELAHGGHPVPRWGFPLPHKATHVIFRFDDGSTLYLTDIRQFCRLWLMHADEVDGFLEEQGFGPEPLTEDFSVPGFRARLRRRSIPIKTALLDQGVVGGIGNIYADESLWEARIHPRRTANSLTLPEIKRLHAAVRSVLAYALREGVATVLQGKALPERDFPYAHGRGGGPCFRGCGATMEKEWVGGRGTHWCPRCQKLPRARPVAAGTPSSG